MIFGVGLLGLAVVLGSVLYSGIALLLLWSWFVVPLGVVPITLPWAIGLLLIANLVKGAPEKAEDESSFWKLLKPLVITTLCLILGYIAHLFM